MNDFFNHRYQAPELSSWPTLDRWSNFRDELKFAFRPAVLIEFQSTGSVQWPVAGARSLSGQ
jgi:hypothetical protein